MKPHKEVARTYPGGSEWGGGLSGGQIGRTVKGGPERHSTARKEHRQCSLMMELAKGPV